MSVHHQFSLLRDRKLNRSSGFLVVPVRGHSSPSVLLVLQQRNDGRERRFAMVTSRRSCDLRNGARRAFYGRREQQQKERERFEKLKESKVKKFCLPLDNY